MRLLSDNLSAKDAKELKEFSEWIIDVGDGKLGGDNDGEAETIFQMSLLLLM